MQQHHCFLLNKDEDTNGIRGEYNKIDDGITKISQKLIGRPSKRNLFALDRVLNFIVDVMMCLLTAKSFKQCIRFKLNNDQKDIFLPQISF